MPAAPPTRPVIRYHGGKWMLADWILKHLPPHRVYVEPFGGAASVLMRKPRAVAEVYGDLDGEVLNVFRVLRDPESAEALRRAVSLTPYSRREYEDARATGEDLDPVERARRAIVRANMGHGSDAINAGLSTGLRRQGRRTGSAPQADWATWPEQVPAFVERLRGVLIEERPAAEVIPEHDGPDTLFYVDPPYVRETRHRGGRRHSYRHEMTDDDHRRLAEVLRSVAGMVVLSGYPCDLYDRELYPDWHRLEREALADGARWRTEVLWLNAAAADRQALPLFDTPTPTPED